MTAEHSDALPTLEPGPPEPSGTAERVVFGRLQTEDPGSLVARRIRTAIGLGVLGNHDKLPKEADLARQLGVTSFALREALGALRAEGIIVTRAGKNGGSFVRLQLDAGRRFAIDELAKISATELRDLGDWRQMLTVQEASLAAVRGSTSSADQLIALAHQLPGADSAETARRIFGRFHLELAAAGHSMRLSRAELVMHEDFDWLTTALLDREQHRASCARAMLRIATAVRDRDTDAARVSAADLIGYLVTELAGSRLGLIAQRHARGTGGANAAVGFVDAVRSFADTHTRRLTDIGGEVAPLLAGATDGATLRAGVARSLLVRLADLEAVHGVGVLAARDVVPGDRYWMEWWQRGPTGELGRNERHVLNPGRDDFYDYSSKEYFVRPRDTGRPEAIGPYVDYGGVDDLVVTVAIPLSDESRFVGIAAIDLRVAELERHFASWLADADGRLMLLNAESRVILSNTVEYNSGDVLPSTEGLSAAEVGWFGWSVVSSATGT
ncbi:GntR family transcriptional regulator [uncultured Amnibacterium sp.]|uniref:GntR family transcriptional regulator n=1 Tax=uncultured Amnibacterium sp. TaxID=1631851 RepID=UPI0035CA6D66